MVQFTIITSVSLLVQLALLAQISIGLPVTARPEEKRHCKRLWVDVAGPAQLLAGLGVGCVGTFAIVGAAWGCYKCIPPRRPVDAEAQPIELTVQNSSRGSPPSAPHSRSDPGPSSPAGTHPQRKRDLTRRQLLDDHERREWNELGSRDLDLDELD